MKPVLQMQRLAVGALVLVAAFGSSALTLGRSQGLALIGRPLDLGVQLALDAGTDPTLLCLEADVFYGDTRIDGSRVSAMLEGGSGANRMARVRSTAPVDEPVVTVYLRVGCGQATTRRYVVLSEQPGDGAAETPAARPQLPIPVPGQAPVAAPAAAARPKPAPASLSTPDAAAAAQEREARRAARAQAREAREAAAAAASAPAAARAAKAPSARERARLKLEPLDLSIERDPTLKATAELAAAAEATAQQRAQAAALWAALNAPPEELLRNVQRLQTLEGDVSSLRAAVHKNNASLTDLRGQLEKAQSERYANPLVYALAGLLLAVIAAAVYGVRRGRSRRSADGGDWWRPGVGQSVLDADRAGPPTRPPPPRPSKAPKSTPGPKSGPPDLDLRVSDSVLNSLSARSGPPSRSGSRTSGHSDFQASLPSSLRAVKAEEVHDIQQQADFFVSLGEHERAIDVLRSHINIFPGTSAVAWLDLLEIYHSLKRREDYESTRQEFLEAFNAEVPAFEAYGDQSQSLEGYPQALSRIVALWPSPRVLDINLDEPPPDSPDFAEIADSGPAFSHSNLVDFDLPDVDTQSVAPRKPRS